MHEPIEQLILTGLDLNTTLSGEPGQGRNGSANKLDAQDRAFHDWYRFVLSYPPHLVRTYLKDFGLDSRHTVLDPFCGTGTTLVEGKLNGVRGIGLEANPFAHFASTVKLDWRVDPELLEERAKIVAAETLQALDAQGIKDNEPFCESVHDAPLRSLDPDAMALLLRESISPLPLHKSLVLLDHIRLEREERHGRHMLLALANALVFKISNLHFGPEVGVQSPKRDVPVVASWLLIFDRCRNGLSLSVRFIEWMPAMLPASLVQLPSTPSLRRRPIQTRKTIPARRVWSQSCWVS